MTRFKMLLHDGLTTPPVIEALDVASADDAIDLAKIALLATNAYTHAVVYCGDEVVETLRRDGRAELQASPASTTPRSQEPASADVPCMGMSKSDDPAPITTPLSPEAVDGYVEAVDPPESKLKMTADAAEISALRLLDAAAKARDT